MKLRETWTHNEPRTCVWCSRNAASCVIVNPCDGRKSFEEELRVSHGDNCGCYWCLPMRPGISPPPSTDGLWRCEVCGAKPGQACQPTLQRKDGRNPQGVSLPGRVEHYARALPPNPKEKP